MNCIDANLFGTVCDSCDGGAIFKILALIIKVLTMGVGVLGVLGIIIAGIMYLTSSGDESKMTKAKRRILEVVIGLIAYGVMFAALQFLLPGGIIQSDLTTSTSSCPVQTSQTGQLPTGGTLSGETGGSQTPTTTPEGSQTGGDTGGTTGGDAGGTTGGDTGGTQTSSGKTKSYSAFGQSWTVADTKTSLDSYRSTLNSHKVAQNSKVCSWSGSCTDSTAENGKCLSYAETFAYDLYYGTQTSDTCAAKYKRSGFGSSTTGDLSTVLSKVYSEITAGRPAVLMVHYTNSPTSRHFVTVIGFRSSVTSASQLTASDLLLLDTNGNLRWSGNHSTVLKPGGGTFTSSQNLELHTQNGSYRVDTHASADDSNPQNMTGSC